MSRITRQNYAHWTNFQKDIFPLVGLRLVEARLNARKSRNILDIGADLTGLGLLTHAQDTPGVEATLALPRAAKLTKKLMHQAHMMKLDERDIVSCASTKFRLRQLPKNDRPYDFVRVLKYGGYPTAERKALLDLVLRGITPNAMLIIYAVRQSDEAQLRADLAAHPTIKFEMWQPIAHLAEVQIRPAGRIASMASTPREPETTSPQLPVEITEDENQSSPATGTASLGHTEFGRTDVPENDD